MTWTRQCWMIVRSPLVKAKQDRSIGVEDLPEIVMSGVRFRLAKQRLIPFATVSNIRNANNFPGPLHRTLLQSDAAAQSRHAATCAATAALQSDVLLQRLGSRHLTIAENEPVTPRAQNTVGTPRPPAA